MSDDKVVLFRKQVIDPLSQLLREGAQRLIAQAVEAELQEFLSGHAERRVSTGARGADRDRSGECAGAEGARPRGRRGEVQFAARTAVRAQESQRGSGTAVVVSERDIEW